MNTAKQDFEITSPQRRALLLAGVGGGAVGVLPGTAAAALSRTASPEPTGGWILSGQVFHGTNSVPLAGARVEVWSDSGTVDAVHTGRDGRFAMNIRLQSVRPEELGSLKYWVSHRDNGSFAAKLGSVTTTAQPAGLFPRGAEGRLSANVGISLADSIA